MKFIKCDVKTCENSKNGLCTNSYDPIQDFIGKNTLAVGKIKDEIYGDDKDRLVIINPKPVEHMCGNQYLYICYFVETGTGYGYLSNQIELLNVITEDFKM